MVTIAVLGYPAFALILQLSGKRTISKKNTFDLFLSIAIGSLLGRTILSPDAVLLEAVATLLTPALLQALFTWLSTKQASVRDLVRPRRPSSSITESSSSPRCTASAYRTRTSGRPSGPPACRPWSRPMRWCSNRTGSCRR